MAIIYQALLAVLRMFLKRNREIIVNFLCKLGFHRWTYDRHFHILDIRPGFVDEYKPPIRKCRKCEKKQQWLPGYGGSEVGCWIP